MREVAEMNIIIVYLIGTNTEQIDMKINGMYG